MAKLRQPSQPEGATYGGIGFYVLGDEGVLDLAKTYHESGFRCRQEVHAAVTLHAERDYILVPMTYKAKVEQTFELELFSEHPLILNKLSEMEATRRSCCAPTRSTPWRPRCCPSSSLHSVTW